MSGCKKDAAVLLVRVPLVGCRQRHNLTVIAFTCVEY